MGSLLRRARRVLPEGRSLPDELWRRRHRGLVRLLWFHVVGLAGFAMVRGTGPAHALVDVAFLVGPAVVATTPRFGRDVRSTAAALGLVTASAVFVHLSGGVVEVHFHYFVVVGLLSLYQAWRPFLLAVGFVAVQHGVSGWIDPDSVYNHYAATNNPWKWAAIHGGFLLAASVANLVAWRLNEHQALHDPLTALPNRALLRDRVQQACTRRDAGSPALLFIDLDNFKAVNDNGGHALGDQLLVAVAQRLVGIVREGDMAARLGGDEFAVVVNDLHDPAGALEVADRVIEAIAQPFQLGAQQVTVTASIGVAVLSGAPDGADDLLRNADMAMYLAKERGKARYEVFDPALRTEVLDRLELEAELHTALQRGELVLHYQPIVDMATGRTTGMEALVRWAHPRRGLLAPGQFVPLAERTGMIVPIGRWVLDRACRQLAVWNADRPGAPIYMSVNLSARQLDDPDIVATVLAALDGAALAPSSLLLELTESTLVEDSGSQLERLRELRAAGVRVAIDDFGTGYSSLSYLRNLPIDVVKIDRSFVQRVTNGIEDEAVVDAIVQMCAALRLAVVAEGVETPAEMAVLQSLGVADAQGFAFARPGPPESARAAVVEPVPAPAMTSRG